MPALSSNDMIQHPMSATVHGESKRQPRVSRETLRLLPLVAPVSLAGLGATATAAWTFASAGHALTCFVGVLVLLLAALFAEAYPVPVENLPAGQVSISSVFIVGTALIYGWAAAVVVGFLTRAVMEIAGRRPPIRLAYNGGCYAL